MLGAFAAAIYGEETVTLEDGDVLALYTEGLMGIRTTRTSLLTEGGATDLLKQQTGIT